MEWLSRTELLLGKENTNILQSKHIVVVGVGGVGAYAAENICRAGIGKITIIDADTVKPSNINRQLIADTTTVNLNKTDILKDRLLKINPQLDITARCIFLEESMLDNEIGELNADLIIDAIDSIAPKVALIEYCLRRKIKIVSSMGAGGRVDPTKLLYSDISKTSCCSLARVVRNRLKQVGITKGLPVVFSTEIVDKKAVKLISDERNKVSTVGTISYMPALFGLYLASYCLRKILKMKI